MAHCFLGVHTEKLCLGKHLEMILVTIDNEIHRATFHHLNSVCSCGLVVRVAASHPGDPGSNPGLGMLLFWVSFHFLPNFKAIFWALGELGRTKGHLGLKLEVLKCL